MRSQEYLSGTLDAQLYLELLPVLSFEDGAPVQAQSAHETHAFHPIRFGSLMA